MKKLILIAALAAFGAVAFAQDQTAPAPEANPAVTGQPTDTNNVKKDEKMTGETTTTTKTKKHSNKMKHHRKTDAAKDAAPTEAPAGN